MTFWTAVFVYIYIYTLSYLLVTFRTRFRSHFDFLCFICRHSQISWGGDTATALRYQLAELATSCHSSRKEGGGKKNDSLSNLSF